MSSHTNLKLVQAPPAHLTSLNIFIAASPLRPFTTTLMAVPRRSNAQPRSQCISITRKGTRCIRNAHTLSSSQRCNTHLRGSLSKTSSTNPLPKPARPYRSGPKHSLILILSLISLAYIPPYIGASTRKWLYRALRRGTSKADKPGYIYAYAAYGRLSFFLPLSSITSSRHNAPRHHSN